MAANDYYNTSYSNAPTPSSPYRDRFDSRSNSSLPPVPPQKSYPSPRLSASHSHVGGSSRYDDRVPSDDEDWIPMSGRRRKHDSQASVAPILPHEQEDLFVRDAQPRERGRDRRKDRDGWFTGKITWVVFVCTVVQIIVFIAMLVRNGIETGSPIMIHPSFNPMIGPSYYIQINMGARYLPCMKTMPNVQNRTDPLFWPCPNTTHLTRPHSDLNCTLTELCGFGDSVPNPKPIKTPTPFADLDIQKYPDQWYRFIVPIFLHAGIIHISFNLLLQLTLGRDVEKLIGSIRFALVYFASGIFGFVLGGNFAADGISSTGCSGSLFGILAITLLDLLYTWREHERPHIELLFILLDIAIAFVLGLLPGLDNFSHIGGFLMGLVLGVCILRSPKSFSRYPVTTSLDAPSKHHRHSTSHLSIRAPTGLVDFVKSPLSFFSNRKGVWWAWWLVRAAALVGALVGFILLLKNFYEWRTTCSWCKYLSCLPVTVGGTDWCKVGNLNFTDTNITQSGNGSGSGNGNGGSSRMARDLYGLDFEPDGAFPVL